LLNVINWSASPDSGNIDSFKIYRSICGVFSSTGPFSVVGKYLKIQTDASDSPRTIKLNSNVIADIISQINLIPGVFSKTEASNQLSVRASGNFIKIFDTDGAAALGLTPGDYVPRKNFSLLSSVPYVSGTGAYQYVDTPGYKNDWYYITTIHTLTLVESLPGQQIQSVDNYLNVCCIEGFVLNFKGAEPSKGAYIKAKLFSASQPDSVSSFSVGADISEAYADEYGRWRLTVPRCATVYLEIPSTGYSTVFVVPNLAAFYFSQIVADNNWRLTNDALPVTGGDFI
jgi:hypothetical protein